MPNPLSIKRLLFAWWIRFIYIIECEILVEGTDTLRNGKYTRMAETCNKMPVWSKPCQGVSSGDIATNTCYIYQNTYDGSSYWSLSPGFCTNSWMATCQAWKDCESHPKYQGVAKTVIWPWDEQLWVNSWWETVKMSCAPAGLILLSVVMRKK